MKSDTIEKALRSEALFLVVAVLDIERITGELGSQQKAEIALKLAGFHYALLKARTAFKIPWDESQSDRLAILVQNVLQSEKLYALAKGKMEDAATQAPAPRGEQD